MTMGSATSGLVSFLFLLLVALGIFLLIRSIMLWYWKVDTLVKNQEDQKNLMMEQKNLLERLVRLQGGESPSYPADFSEEVARKAKLYDDSQKK